jgi:hypothetical protein
MIIDILLGILSASYTLQTVFSVNEKMKRQHIQYVEDLVKESVEHSYVTYIYDIKQQCKQTNSPFEYNKYKAHEIASEYFYDSYSKPWFGRSNKLKINKRIKDEFRFYRAKSNDIEGVNQILFPDDSF